MPRRGAAIGANDGELERFGDRSEPRTSRQGVDEIRGAECALRHHWRCQR